MGACLSLPLMLVPSWATCTTCAAACCGAATCSALCSSCGKCQNSMATRIAYAVILLINSLLAWIMSTDWAIQQLQHMTFDYVTISCNGKDCYGFVTVHRINFALGAFHAILAILLIGVRSSREPRAAIQNGYWGPKILAWIGLIVITFFIPDAFFIAWGNYVAFIGAILFLLLGLILLVDLAHLWAEYCLARIEETNSRLWRSLLIGSTVGMYLSSIAMIIVMYVFFAGGGCSMNQAAITVNLLLMIIVSAISIHPTIQEANARAGLAQSAMVTFYCTYLTMSAVAMEPDDQQCNPLVRAEGTRTASIVLGAIITFLTVAYTTTRAATYGLALGGSQQPAGYSQLSSADSEHGLTTTGQPASRREMRAEALRAAVDSGALPASALDSDSDSDDDDDHNNNNSSKKSGIDDEKHGTQYNYSLFHFIFLLSTAWVATLLAMSFGDNTTDPHTGETAFIFSPPNNSTSPSEVFIPVGRTYWASWIKIVSAWVCYAIFGWSLAAPVAFPDRFDY